MRPGPIICAPKRPVLPASAPPVVRGALSRPCPPAGAPVRARLLGFFRCSSSSGDAHLTRSAQRGPSAPAPGGRPTLRPLGTEHHYAQQRPMDPRPNDRGAVLLTRTLLLRLGLPAKPSAEEHTAPLRALRPTNSKPRWVPDSDLPAPVEIPNTARPERAPRPASTASPGSSPDGFGPSLLALLPALPTTWRRSKASSPDRGHSGPPLAQV